MIFVDVIYTTKSFIKMINQFEFTLTQWTMAILLFFTVISLAYFIIHRDPRTKSRDLTYLYYSGYCFNMFILFLRNWLLANSFEPEQSLAIEGTSIAYVMLMLQTTPVLLYSGFAYHFVDDIDIKNIRSKIWLRKFLQCVFLVLVAYNIISILVHQLLGNSDCALKMIQWYPPIAISIGFLAIFVFFTRVKSDLIAFVIIGSIGIAVGAAISHLIVQDSITIGTIGTGKVLLVCGDGSGENGPCLQSWFQVGTLFDTVVIAIALIVRSTNSKRSLSHKPAPLSRTSKKDLSKIQGITIRTNGHSRTIQQQHIIRILAEATRGLFVVIWVDTEADELLTMPLSKDLRQSRIVVSSVGQLMKLLDDNYHFFLARARQEENSGPMQIINRNFISRYEYENKHYLIYLRDKTTVKVAQGRKSLFEHWISLELRND